MSHIRDLVIQLELNNLVPRDHVNPVNFTSRVFKAELTKPEADKFLELLLVEGADSVNSALQMTDLNQIEN